MPEENSFKPRVAVLLAAYNGQEFIVNQIDSVLNQVGVVVTIFVSVDHSTDQTYDIIKQHYNKHSTVVLLPYGQRFGSASKNFYNLILNAHWQNYDFVAFCDQDDFWLPTKLYQACCELNRNNCDCYSSNLEAVWNDGRRTVLDKSAEQRLYDHFFSAISAGCTYVLRSDALLSLKEFLSNNPHFLDFDSHDWLIYALSRELKFGWFVDKKSYIFYNQHRGNSFGANVGVRAKIKRWCLILNGWYGRHCRMLIHHFNEELFMSVNSGGCTIEDSLQFRRNNLECFFLFVIIKLKILRI